MTVLEPPSSTNLDHRSFSVSYEEYDELFPAKQCATNLQLTSLIPKCLAISINNVPSALNPIIAAASFEISASQISFMGALTSQSSQLQSQSTSQPQSKSTQVSTPTATRYPRAQCSLHLSTCYVRYQSRHEHPAHWQSSAWIPGSGPHAFFAQWAAIL